MRKSKKLFQAVPKRYVSGESYDLLGKSLRLKVEANKDETVYTDGVYIFLRVKDKDDFRHKEIMMSKWFKQYQTTVFEELLQEKYLLFAKIWCGISYIENQIYDISMGIMPTEKGYHYFE